MSLLDAYAELAGRDVVDHLRQLARSLAGRRIVHVNSTRVGGGVAEILDKMVPLTRELGLGCEWEVIEGEGDFYRCTKAMHNALQGQRQEFPEHLLEAYEETNRRNAERLRPSLEEADFVVIHDPQPAPLLDLCPGRRGRWIWRCHIDASHPQRTVWRYLRPWIVPYDASIYSLADFARPLPHPQYIVPPSIDALSDKNVELPAEEIDEVLERFDLDSERPIAVQVSRFDHFKDPVGVLHAYHLAKRHVPGLQIVLAGGGASDDPEGEAVLAEARQAAGDDPDAKVLLLPADAHRTINALQRAADVVIQKSTREGFGLTVTEALWKGKPVIGGDVGGIRLQVLDHHTGFRVSSPEGAALRLRYLLNDPERMALMGHKARELVRENFLLTRHLREYLTLMVALLYGAGERIDLEL